MMNWAIAIRIGIAVALGLGTQGSLAQAEPLPGNRVPSATVAIATVGEVVNRVPI